jgi:hypothetical protein
MIEECPSPSTYRLFTPLTQSSKLRLLIETLDRIRERREKVIVFARVRTMQATRPDEAMVRFTIHQPPRPENGDFASSLA